MGQFKVSHAAFPTISKFGDSENFLLVSSFSGAPGPLGKGAIYVTAGLKDAVTNNTVKKLKSVKVSGIGSFEWPNDIKVVPDDVFADTKRAIVVPDGFLVPGKANGGVYLITMDNSDVTKATKRQTMASNKNGYFYHMGYWVDMNGDGRKDFITAKSNMQPNEGKLVWYEHPVGGLSSTAPWVEHVITTGPDVGFTTTTTLFKNELTVFASEFFNQKVVMYRVSLKDGTLIGSPVVIDDTTILEAYSVAIVNLDNNKEKQLLINNHEKDDKTNGVFAYTFPKNLMTGTWVKTTLASNFKNKFSLLVPNMAPGFPYTFWPKVSDEGKKPGHILVAGDGDYSAHIMTHTGKLTYDRDLIKDFGGTVGAITWADIDNDGWNEVFIPNYDKSYVEIFKVSAKAAAVFLQ